MVANKTSTSTSIEPVDLQDARFKKLRSKFDQLMAGRERMPQVVDAAIQHSKDIDDMLVAPKDVGFDIANDGRTPTVTLDGNDTELVHKHAVRQLATKVGLNRGFVSDMLESDREWAPELLQNAIARHASEVDDRLLWRVAPFDDQPRMVRGVLSDKYRRIDTGILFNAFAKHTDRLQLAIVRGDNTQTKSFLEAVEPQVRHIVLPNQGDYYAVFGIRLANSEYGDGSLALQLFDMRIWCHNLMMTNTMIRQKHVGSQISDDSELSLETRALESAVQASRLRDQMKALMGGDAFIDRALALQHADEKILEPEPVFTALPKVGLTDSEINKVRDILTTNNEDAVPTGPLTRFKLSQAVANLARGASAYRQRTLEDLAGNIVDGKGVHKFADAVV